METDSIKKSEVGGTPPTQNAPETWEVRHSQDSKGGMLNDSRERELIEPTSSRKTGHQMKEEGHPTVTTLTHNCFWSALLTDKKIIILYIYEV
jgi:hypothetical protein